MSTTFHENYTAAEVPPPSERSTGLVFAGVAAILAVLWRKDATAPWAAMGVAVILVSVSLVAPALLKPLNVFWFRVGLVMHRVVNPLVMGVVFVLVFVPAGAIMRLWKDPLKLKRSARLASTHWVDRKGKGTDEASMSNQF